MFVGPIVSEGVDDFLFETFIDPVLPNLPFGLPTPLPVRIGLAAIELQIDAGKAIEEGRVMGKSQYTGQAATLDRASVLGYNLIYQPGGMKI